MLNHVTLIGHLGKDPEVRFTGTGIAVCKFSVATSEKWTNTAGEPQEETQWHNIIVWRKQAESCGKYLSKGRLVAIEGKVTYRSWDKPEGGKGYITEIVAANVRFLPSGGDPKEPRQTRNEPDCAPQDQGGGGDPEIDF